MDTWRPVSIYHELKLYKMCNFVCSSSSVVSTDWQTSSSLAEPHKEEAQGIRWRLTQTIPLDINAQSTTRKIAVNRVRKVDNSVKLIYIHCMTNHMLRIHFTIKPTEKHLRIMKTADYWRSSHQSETVQSWITLSSQLPFHGASVLTGCTCRK
jgi:hypothetical protein